MQLKKIISQYRNDYTGEMQCEFCQAKYIDKYGYFDDNYMYKVIPAMKCPSCGKSTNSEEIK